MCFLFLNCLLTQQIDANRKRIDISDGGEVRFFGDVIQIRIVVTPVNDKPVIKRNRADLEPVPYDLNATSYSGTRIKDVFSQCKACALVEDIDDSKMELGAVILAAGNSSLGQWQYRLNDSMPFTDFNLTKDVNVMLLPPEATYVKFRLCSSSRSPFSPHRRD